MRGVGVRKRAGAVQVLGTAALYVMRRQPRRHQGRIMRSRVNVQIGLSVRSSRACLKPSFSRPLREALATGSLCLCLIRPGDLRGVVESRMMKPRVEMHAYSGLRRLLLVSYRNASLVNFCVDKRAKKRVERVPLDVRFRY